MTCDEKYSKQCLKRSLDHFLCTKLAIFPSIGACELSSFANLIIAVAIGL